ncbi:MAG: ribonuclease P protein component [Aeromicrobium sp.]
MLARGNRMRTSEDFRQTIRFGRRSARPTLVAHVVPGGTGPTSVGFVVGKAVGPAVVRNRVKRRLRHLLRSRVDQLPAGTHLVIRALPPTAGQASSSLAGDLDAALTRSGAL